MDNSKEEIQIEDEGGFSSGKDKKSFKNIILKQFEKCTIEGSKEMTTGGIMKRNVGDQIVEIVVPNQIEIMINSIDMLKLLLSAEIPKKAKIAEKANIFEDKRRELVKSHRIKKQQLFESYFKKSNKPDPEGVTERDKESPRYKAILKNLENNYNSKILILYQEMLFPILVNLLALNDYFEESGSTISLT